MINLYQPGLLNFISLKCGLRASRSLGTGRSAFYLSFEDALFDISAHLKIPKGGLFLVPDFYCMEVIENLERWGYAVKTYPLGPDFSCSSVMLKQLISDCQPAGVIVYHPLGMESSLVRDLSWLEALAPEALLIEDAAHQLREPKRNEFLTVRHFIIDSIRKVSPLQGSHVFYSELVPAIPFQPSGVFNSWRFKVISHYWIWRLAFCLSKIIESDLIWNFSEKSFERYNQEIGAGPVACRGLMLSRFLWKWLDFSAIKKHKRELFGAYQKKALSLCTGSSNFFAVQLSDSSASELKFFPIGVRKELSQKLGVFLMGAKLFLDPIFSDCPYCKDKDYFALPMDPTIKARDIDAIFMKLSEFEQLLTKV